MRQLRDVLIVILLVLVIFWFLGQLDYLFEFARW